MENLTIAILIFIKISDIPCVFQIFMLTLPQNINHKENRSWIITL